ncbi:tRNA pseudouridine(38-40) synthase TruA [Natronolimnobius sp. AArcel1]|uniref:tRNA pseudouridine(38-40) synthase TruA n=1 Tax=Natronolimnobius sp. AArcel1 TaxID=1679093 RepID=UPI0013EDA087|nr:tRNA pseudouridine(38-40) synthase TruA [Natronolimnobius sp. AArcel1]NGM70203.1 tRNA pseudouridine(38-40) synthase TruA [Natronolimnobius sp. AArcel1]
MSSSSLHAFRVAYDGTGYYGFQRQPDVPTVEDSIFDALRGLEVLAPDAAKPAGYAAAGRTDAGVSALAQTITLEAPDWLTPHALNSTLPADVRAWASADAPNDFHATHHASRRTYTYYLYAPETTVDDNRFAAACDALSGPHDFHNLTPDNHNTERAPTLEAVRDGHYLVLTVTAGGFARELVRQLVSLAHDVGTGRATLETLERALDPDPLPGHEGIAPAPPEPLVLTGVDYPDLEFAVDPDAADSAQKVFETRRLERQTAARVASHIESGIDGDANEHDGDALE